MFQEVTFTRWPPSSSVDNLQKPLQDSNVEYPQYKPHQPPGHWLSHPITPALYPSHPPHLDKEEIKIKKGYINLYREYPPKALSNTLSGSWFIRLLCVINYQAPLLGVKGRSSCGVLGWGGGASTTPYRCRTAGGGLLQDWKFISDM